MTSYTLSNKAIRIKRLQSTILLILICFILGGTAVFSPLISLVSAAAAIVIYIAAITIYLKKWYESYSYSIRSQTIIVNKGVIINKSIVVFKNEIQYCAVVQTPLQRIFHACTVVIHTAGAMVYIGDISLTNSEPFLRMNAEV